MTELRENEGDERRRGCRATGRRIDFSLNAGMSLRGEKGRGLVGAKAAPVLLLGAPLAP